MPCSTSLGRSRGLTRMSSRTGRKRRESATSKTCSDGWSFRTSGERNSSSTTPGSSRGFTAWSPRSFQSWSTTSSSTGSSSSTSTSTSSIATARFSLPCRWRHQRLRGRAHAKKGCGVLLLPTATRPRLPPCPLSARGSLQPQRGASDHPREAAASASAAPANARRWQQTRRPV